jgi:hypothetical protein
MRDEADAAGIVFVLGIVKTLSFLLHGTHPIASFTQTHA